MSVHPTPVDCLASMSCGQYDIILTDPPWHFTSNSRARPGRNALRHYACMSDADIEELPVERLAKPDALLFMWTTAPMLRRAITIPESWGFRYVTELCWVKDRIGTGFWARNQHEIVLMYRRGKFPCPRPAPFASSVIEGARREHSRKPDGLHKRINAIWPNARKLEMFARQSRDGWDVWGNQTSLFDGGVA